MGEDITYGGDFWEGFLGFCGGFGNLGRGSGVGFGFWGGLDVGVWDGRSLADGYGGKYLVLERKG